MSSYKEICDKLTKSSADSKRFSKGDLVELTTALLNEEDHEVEYFSNPSGNTPVSVVKEPVKAYRESLKPVLAQFGIDKSEMDKIHSINFDKKQAEALLDVAQVAQHDYVATGKKMKLPQLAADETTTTLERVKLEKKVEDTKKTADGPDGKKIQVPTGKTIETSARVITKASNKVPGWLKKEV